MTGVSHMIWHCLHTYLNIFTSDSVQWRLYLEYWRHWNWTCSNGRWVWTLILVSHGHWSMVSCTLTNKVCFAHKNEPCDTKIAHLSVMVHMHFLYAIHTLFFRAWGCKSWCPCRDNTNSDPKFGVQGTLSVFTVCSCLVLLLVLQFFFHYQLFTS